MTFYRSLSALRGLNEENIMENNLGRENTKGKAQRWGLTGQTSLMSRPSTILSSIHPSTHPPIHLLVILFISASIHLSIYPSIHLSHSSINVSIIYPPIHQYSMYWGTVIYIPSQSWRGMGETSWRIRVISTDMEGQVNHLCSGTVVESVSSVTHPTLLLRKFPLSDSSLS